MNKSTPSAPVYAQEQVIRADPLNRIFQSPMSINILGMDTIQKQKTGTRITDTKYFIDYKLYIHSMGITSRMNLYD